MGTPGPSSQQSLDETLDAFAEADVPGTPLTAAEVADAVGCPRETAADNLATLAELGELETRTVRSGERVWWRPAGEPESDSSAGRTDTGAADSAFEQAQFQKLVETVTDYAIFVLDADGCVQTWNEGARQLKGYEDDEIVGRHFSTFYTEADREADVPGRNLEKAAENGRVEDEGWRVRQDGSRFWANVTITALRGDDGDVRGFVKVTRDMTERHEQEERLRKEKERFETLVREVKDYAIFLLDAEGYVQTWNEGARQLKGYEDDEIVGRHFSTFYTEANREAGRPERNLATAVKDGRVEDEGWRVRQDGSRFWANVTITALRGDDGDVRGFAKVTRDMTERHEYEERLREQRNELDELNQINEVIRDIDHALVTSTSREEIEQAVCDRLANSDTYLAAWIGEYTDDYEDVTPRTWAGISDEYLETVRSADAGAAEDTEKGVGAAALQSRSIQPVQQLQRDLAGEPWREASVAEGFRSAITVPLVYEDVEYGVLTVYADDESAFDERKIAVMGELGETISHAIAAIRRKERERTLTALQESTHELIQTGTRDGVGDIVVETLTEDIALDDALVYYVDDDAGRLEPASSSFPDADRLAPVEAGDDSPVWTAFTNGEIRFTGSVVATEECGERRTMVVPLGDHGVLAVAAVDQETFDGKMRKLVELVAATAEAALERTDRERRLHRQNDRLDSFASMLAHELRNPVTIGQIYSQQLPDGTESGANTEAVEYVTEAFDRIEDMIDVLLVLARGHEAVDEQAPVDLAEVAREAWDEVDAPEATLDVAVDRTIQADGTYVRHLFRNLFDNAVEHGGRDVTVTVGDLPSGFYVADDGVGIPAENRERVFETGYTTAAEEGGTGLGLAFVEELAEVYEWNCAVTESESGGAQFEFRNVDGVTGGDEDANGDENANGDEDANGDAE